MVDTKYITYSGFWKRFVATLIDMIMQLIIGVILVISLILVGFDAESLGEENNANSFGLLVGWFYYALMESSPTQGTVGKILLKIKVTDMDGNRIGFWKATGRHFGKFISILIFMIGFVMVAFTKKKQGLHDIMSNCLVINK